MEEARTREQALHLMGLISDGQVHSSLTHLYALLKMAKEHGAGTEFISTAFSTVATLRRPRPRQYVATLQRKIAEIGCGEIATVIGRYYAMDRDKRWERTQRAYDLLTKAIGLRRDRSDRGDQRVVRAWRDG